ncbi:MAG: alpha/beta hydrolase [Acidobacteria bacterium]|nr:alpha/beta hydrolase [Acidobacteriota bacterium]
MTWRAIGVLGVFWLASLAGTGYLAGWYFGQGEYPEGTIVSTLRSGVLDEDREILVHLPEGYESEPGRRYPVIYVLDGSSQDIHTASTAALMARIGVMPPLIVVGLPNVSGEGRQRDYTPPTMAMDVDIEDSPRGSADRFLAFLKTELIPDIERRYRTTSERMLAGHSRGGLFVAWSLTADPALFQARFAHSPALWRDDVAMAGILEHFLAATPALDSFFYMSLGSKETAEMTEGFSRVRAVLEARAPENLRWRADIVQDAVHRNNGEWATPLGFTAYYGEGAAPAALGDAARHGPTAATARD